MSDNIILIGGEGYIGTVVSKYLVAKDYEVISFDNLIYQNSSNVISNQYHPNYSFIFGDIRDEYKLNQVLDRNSNVIILAGLVGDPITKKYPLISEQINNIGIKNVIDISINKKVKKIVFISTCSNYGVISDEDVADENFILNPLSSYAKSKVENEKYLLNNSNENTSITILRFATAFGISPRTRFDLTVNEFVKTAYLNKKLIIYDKETWRPYCHVNDFARAIELIIREDQYKVNNQIYNVGGDENNFTKKMILDKIKQKVSSLECEFIEDSKDRRNYKVSFEKIQNELNFKINYSVDYGINELLQAFKSNIFNFSDENTYGNYLINEK